MTRLYKRVAAIARTLHVVLAWPNADAHREFPGLGGLLLLSKTTLVTNLPKFLALFTPILCRMVTSGSGRSLSSSSSSYDEQPSRKRSRDSESGDSQQPRPTQQQKRVSHKPRKGVTGAQIHAAGFAGHNNGHPHPYGAEASGYSTHQYGGVVLAPTNTTKGMHHPHSQQQQRAIVHNKSAYTGSGVLAYHTNNVLSALLPPPPQPQREGGPAAFINNNGGITGMQLEQAQRSSSAQYTQQQPWIVPKSVPHTGNNDTARWLPGDSSRLPGATAIGPSARSGGNGLCALTARYGVVGKGCGVVASLL